MSGAAVVGGRLARDRLVVRAGLSAVAALAWVYLAVRTDPMSGADDTVPMGLMGFHEWSTSDYLLTWTMWVVMMVAMVLPSIIALTQVYVAIGRKARREGRIVPPTAVFVAGYLLVWAAFSVAATTAQLLLDRAALLSDTARTTSLTMAGVLLVATGAYELTPLKRACLRACRGPVDFVARHWRKGTVGALRLGARAGLFCLGCCAMLMALLFLGGVMNLLWVALVSAFVLVEKLVPAGERVARAGGLAMTAGGLGLLVVAVL